jgi:hypothetical protein
VRAEVEFVNPAMDGFPQIFCNPAMFLTVIGLLKKINKLLTQRQPVAIFLPVRAVK